jgi:hypothetical protein
MIRRAMIAGGVVAGLAGAFVAGTMANRPGGTEVSKDKDGRPLADSTQVQAAETNGLKIPDVLPPAKPDNAAGTIGEPANVLAGVKPVPVDVLRAPPPEQRPEFVVPDLPAPKK